MVLAGVDSRCFQISCGAMRRLWKLLISVEMILMIDVQRYWQDPFRRIQHWRCFISTLGMIISLAWVGNIFFGLGVTHLV